MSYELDAQRSQNLRDDNAQFDFTLGHQLGRDVGLWHMSATNIPSAGLSELQRILGV